MTKVYVLQEYESGTPMGGLVSIHSTLDLATDAMEKFKLENRYDQTHIFITEETVDGEG